MPVFYIAMNLESFIHCSHSLKKKTKTHIQMECFSLLIHTNLKSKHLIKIGLLASIKKNYFLNFLSVYLKKKHLSVC